MFFSFSVGAYHRKGLLQVIENGIYKVGLVKVEVTLDASEMGFGEDLIYM